MVYNTNSDMIHFAGITHWVPVHPGENKKTALLFQGWKETLIWSTLDGCMGQMFTDHVDHPSAGMILIADFAFLAGKASVDLSTDMRKQAMKMGKLQSFIAVPRTIEWEEALERSLGTDARPVTRYATRKEQDVWNLEYLQSLTERLPEEFRLRAIDDEIFRMARQQTWSQDLVSQFKDAPDYETNGVGMAVLHNGELVAGASSYTVYNGGIEIEIDTREDFRRRGLATVCGAGLILSCKEKDLYPSWDAQNLWSLALAEKLGYHFDGEYKAYEIANGGNRK